MGNLLAVPSTLSLSLSLSLIVYNNTYKMFYEFLLDQRLSIKYWGQMCQFCSHLLHKISTYKPKFDKYCW